MHCWSEYGGTPVPDAYESPRATSVLVAYAVLRLGGHGQDEAARLIATHRLESELVPAYRDSVERWLRGR